MLYSLINVHHNRLYPMHDYDGVVVPDCRKIKFFLGVCVVQIDLLEDMFASNGLNWQITFDSSVIIKCAVVCLLSAQAATTASE